MVVTISGIIYEISRIIDRMGRGSPVNHSTTLRLDGGRDGRG